jgi:hypothetical protein
MSSGNPYESPKTQSHAAPKTASTGKLVCGILLLIWMVPASAVAFFYCCNAGAKVAARPEQGWNAGAEAGMIAGSIGGLLTLALMLSGGIIMIRRSKQPPTA